MSGDKVLIAAGVVAAGVASKFGWDWWSEKQEREEAEEAEEAQRVRAEQMAKEQAHRERLTQARATIEEFEAFWRDNGNRVVVIDSNIWMEQSYHQLFEALPEQLKPINGSITIQPVQFDELTNLKNQNYRTTKSKLGRRAMNRIEQMQRQGAVNVATESNEAKKGAYADTAILDLICEDGVDLTRAQIITDDRELRIRGHQKLKDAGADSFAVLEGKEFQTQFFDYRVALDLVAKEEEG
jgi:rRNA-processing protein FCF1